MAELCTAEDELVSELWRRLQPYCSAAVLRHSAVLAVFSVLSWSISGVGNVPVNSEELGRRGQIPKVLGSQRYCHVLLSAQPAGFPVHARLSPGPGKDQESLFGFHIDFGIREHVTDTFLRPAHQKAEVTHPLRPPMMGIQTAGGTPSALTYRASDTTRWPKSNPYRVNIGTIIIG